MINQFVGKYFFLSNFYPSEIIYEEKTYKTVEHFFQAYKTLEDKDREFIQNAPTPKEAKRRGRLVNLREDWDFKRYYIMRIGLILKFIQNPELNTKLVETRPHILIEGNFWHDNTWGDCYCSKCKNIEGGNLLGKLLMLLRDTGKNSKIGS
jgi:hypothetical protein